MGSIFKTKAPKIEAPEPMPIADATDDEKEKLRARQQMAAQAAASGRQSTMLVPADSGSSKLGGK